MNKIAVLTLGFMKWQIIAKSFEQLYRTKSIAWEHHVLDQHYPLNEKENRDSLRDICLDYKATLHDAGKNLGLHEGVNYLIQKTQPKVVIGYDPDSFPLRVGWDDAITKVLCDKVVWSTLGNPRSLSEVKARGYQEVNYNFVRCWVTKQAVVNSVCAWWVPWLEEVKLTEPRPFYGHLETEMFSKLKGREWVFLPGFEESDHLRWQHDKEYTLYKWAHAHLKSWDGDFKSWLEAGMPHERPAPEKLP
jgi:hypothetical protein